MMKFATYENIVEMAYKHLIPTPKDQTSKPVQLGVSFGSGYVAGVFCAAISHPADNLVSFLNNAKGATVADVNTAAYLNSTLLPFMKTCVYSPGSLFLC
jgi:solute carrier family 25 phosphate transporter 3